MTNLTGTQRADKIMGGGDDDRIAGGEGDDYVVGGPWRRPGRDFPQRCRDDRRVPWRSRCEAADQPAVVPRGELGIAPRFAFASAWRTLPWGADTCAQPARACKVRAVKDVLGMKPILVSRSVTIGMASLRRR